MNDPKQAQGSYIYVTLFYLDARYHRKTNKIFKDVGL